MRVLLVEDETDFAQALRGALERERFVVDHADRLSVAHEAVLSVNYDLVLLDRTLPDGDGLSMIPALHAGNPGMPIIVLSARGEVFDRVAGLDEGADDYLIKPFALDEMFARIRAVRRRPTDVGREEIRVTRNNGTVTNYPFTRSARFALRASRQTVLRSQPLVGSSSFRKWSEPTGSPCLFPSYRRKKDA